MKSIKELEKILEHTRNAISVAATKEEISSILSQYVSETQEFTMDENLRPIEIETSRKRREKMDNTEGIRKCIAVNPDNRSLKELKETASGALIILENYIKGLE